MVEGRQYVSGKAMLEIHGILTEHFIAVNNAEQEELDVQRRDFINNLLRVHNPAW